MKGRALFDRFIEKVRTDPITGCWEWQGSRDVRGYGRLNVNAKPMLAHRAAWELLVGPIPTGLMIDHLCRNHACVRPDHLEPVTQRENLLRGVGIPAINAAKVTCDLGHPLTPTTRSRRECQECRIARRRARHRARQANDPEYREAAKERARRQRERNAS